MKLSHLSLAILSALALAACGGSGSDSHVTPDSGATNPDAGNTNQGKKEEEKKEEEKKEEVAKEDAEIVDPTGDNVVDAIVLAETSTTASQQYLRGAESNHDRIANPDEPASATALSGISLDVQNPQLTNIVIGRINDKNSNGEQVKIAQFAGSNDKNMASLGGVAGSLQEENRANALVGSPKLMADANSGFGFVNSNGSWLNGTYSTIAKNPEMGVANEPFKSYLEAYRALKFASFKYDGVKKEFDKAAAEAKAANQDIAQDLVDKLTTEANNLETAVGNFANAEAAAKPSFDLLKIKMVKQSSIDVVESVSKNASKPYDTKKVVIPRAPSRKDLAKYGFGTAWFTDFASDAGWGDTIDANGDVVGVTAGQNAVANNNLGGLPTTGLVGIYRDANGKWVVRGNEDNNVRTTRIFGHYYIDPLSKDGLKLAPEGFNSWTGANTFIYGIDANTNKPNEYAVGVKPVVLNHVQYGRVTAEIEDINVGDEGATVGWRKDKQEYANRDPKKLGDADDFYFYRGTGATTIKQMGNLPTDAKIAYEGHALMYGIDNSFHGGGLDLPNAFGNEQNYGIGNFVSATLDMGTKKFSGDVYNAWHSPSEKNIKKDVLVEFSGDVMGNTVIGEASRTYVTEDRPADFRASFYGSNADEVGGAFNSVKRQDPYGPIGWGGVFGAKRTSSGGNSWLVSSEEK